MNQTPIQADLIVSPSWIISVNENFEILENHSLVVKDGKILDILDKQQAQGKYSGNSLELESHALLPGFINSHCHSAMSLLRGYAEDQPLQSWLSDSIWPAEGKWVSEDFVRDGSLLACAEMIKSGTTCFNDMYFFPDVVANIAEASKMRACLSFPVLEFPSAWAQNADEYIDKGLALQDQYKNHAMIGTAFGPHAPYTVSLETMARITTLAEEIDSNIHIHLHENAQEVADHKKEHGKSAIEQYADKGFLSPRLQAVHMTQLSEQELNLVEKFGVNIVHCPESNMKLASGIAPLDQIEAKNINLALGTDGCASNNDLDMIGEMKSAGLLAKVSSGNANTAKAENLLRMATINGAKVLGIEEQCGSLEVGKSADMISIDFSTLDCVPLYNPVSQIIYSASKNQVSNVWISGEQLLKEKSLCLIDEKEVMKKAQHWQQKIATH
jgi:5-methylthioadenosine/S-adenosylhomocysteine deaminase